MGGSLALALQGKCAAVYGYDPDPSTLNLAEQMNLLDGLTGELANFTPQSDLVILAAPVMSILSLIDLLPECHPGSPVVMDIGSTKLRILQSMEKLPDRFAIIGGHPICGKEKSSLKYSEAGLFQGSSFVLCASLRTSQKTRIFAEEFVRTIGSFPLWMEAEKHDRLVAATSHFPYLLSNIMAAVTPEEAKMLIGPGFRSTARIASSSPGMMSDIIMTNRHNLLNQIRSFQEYLELMKTLIEDEEMEQLIGLLERGAQAYHRLLA